MMRKGCLVLVLALMGPGCVSPGTKVEEEARKTPAVRVTETAPPAPPTVTADQVTDGNAAAMAAALARELDYDANQRSAAGPAKETMTKP
jgi:hypothetical protein